MVFSLKKVYNYQKKKSIAFTALCPRICHPRKKEKCRDGIMVCIKPYNLMIRGKERSAL